ncbi:MAG: aspartate/glutamate/glutamine transport system substrate-binding protein [Chloroflexota bacterium]|nr:aspartate/glutamate/glutamine transport system substrate-binding protein [Chloroflexota bacterium]
MRRRLLVLLAVSLVACAACAPPTGSSSGGVAQAPAGTGLRKVQDRGKLVIGVKYDVPTFGYLNPRNNQLEGFDVDLGKAIAREVLGNESKAEFVQAKSADRNPFLASGQADQILSTMTANEERAQQIDFTDAYYIAGQSLLVKKDSTITGLKDVGGKTVCSATGSTSEQNIRQKAPAAQLILFDTYSECLQALDTSRAEAVSTDDIILIGLAKDAPDKYKVVGGQFTIEPYAGGLAKGNAELLTAIDAAIQKVKASGEWKKIYEKNLPGVAVPKDVPPVDWRDVYKMTPTGA